MKITSDLYDLYARLITNKWFWCAFSIGYIVALFQNSTMTGKITATFLVIFFGGALLCWIWGGWESFC